MSIFEAEQGRRATQRAMSITEFSERYGVSRSTTYEEIKCGRLRAHKCGKRTIITEDDAENWLRSLRVMESATVTAIAQSGSIRTRPAG
jgi:excisionase family DNA binding protein